MGLVEMRNRVSRWLALGIIATLATSVLAPSTASATGVLECTPSDSSTLGATSAAFGEQKGTWTLHLNSDTAPYLGCVGTLSATAALVPSAFPDGAQITVGGTVMTTTAQAVTLTSNSVDITTADGGDYSLVFALTDTVSGDSQTITVTFTAVPPPVCYAIQLYGLVWDAAQASDSAYVSNYNAQWANNVNLAYDSNTGFGCRTYGSEPLLYKIDPATVYHGALTPSPASPAAYSSTDTYSFVPEQGFIAPQDWLTADQTVTFSVRAKDAFGQESVTALGESKAVSTSIQITRPVSASCAVNPQGMTSQTYFNNPIDYSHPDNRFLITDKMIEYIDCAGNVAQADWEASGSHAGVPSNVVVLMSWFSLTDKDVVNALVRAKSHHANVRFLINSHATQPVSSSYASWSSLRSALGTNAPTAVRNAATPGSAGTGSWALYCDHGCLTPPCVINGINRCKNFPADSEAEYPALHSKFFTILFPAAGDGKQTTVVGVASSNPTREQALRGWNNMQVTVERSTNWNSNTLFKSINTYAHDLAAQGSPGAEGNPATAYRTLATTGATSFTAFPRPGTGSSTDTISQALGHVKCRYLDKHGKLQRTQIYVNMFVFTRNSPAMVLWHLAFDKPADGGGCQIHVIYTDMDSAIRSVTPGTYGQWLTKQGYNIAYGAADCLSAPGTRNGKWSSMFGVSRQVKQDENNRPILKKGKKQYVKRYVCNRGTLQGLMPTINTWDKSLCWLNHGSSVSGGSIDACVSTPLKLTPFDPADGRAKLEYWPDADGHYSYSHQKYVLIDGFYGRKIQKLVFAGTPNLTNPGLRWNDEIMTVTTGASMFNQYKANFTRMKAYIKGRPGARATTSGSVYNCRATGQTPCKES